MSKKTLTEEKVVKLQGRISVMSDRILTLENEVKSLKEQAAHDIKRIVEGMIELKKGQ